MCRYFMEDLRSGCSGASGIARAAGKQQVVDDQEHDRANHGDPQAVEVESGHSGHAEPAEQPAADHGANDAEHDVQEKSFARFVDDLAGDESGDESENDPGDEGHETSGCRRFGTRLSGPDGREWIYNMDCGPGLADSDRGLQWHSARKRCRDSTSSFAAGGGMAYQWLERARCAASR